MIRNRKKVFFLFLIFFQLPEDRIQKTDPCVSRQRDSEHQHERKQREAEVQDGPRNDPDKSHGNGPEDLRKGQNRRVAYRHKD